MRLMKIHQCCLKRRIGLCPMITEIQNTPSSSSVKAYGLCMTAANLGHKCVRVCVCVVCVCVCVCACVCMCCVCVCVCVCVYVCKITHTSEYGYSLRNNPHTH